MEAILIVEDDPTMLRGLKDNFEFHGYRVLTADDGEAGLNAALNARPDLILLDLMLPKINGYEVCRLIRKEKLEMPIIMLTAKGEESDIVLGLNLGADDYVTKPFSIKELLARTEALLRRMRSAELEVYRFGDCELDIAARKLTRGAEEIKLSPKEFRLLELFVKKPGRALSRDEILNSSGAMTRSPARARSTASSRPCGTRSSPIPTIPSTSIPSADRLQIRPPQ
jgi:DNA-binding response OmpR family regulator